MDRSHILSRRSLLTAGLSSASLLALNACASISSNGAVNHYADSRADSATQNSEINPEGPQPGASPEEIIRGFFHAGIGPDNDYEVARRFLTDDLSESWRPDARTLIHTNSLSVTAEPAEERRFRATVPATTEIDEVGLATSFAEESTEYLLFNLTQVQGEWRISEAPDGLVLEQSEFEQSFDSFTLYFYDPTFTYAVPDVRWFADRSSVATSIVRVLLQGPAPYLLDAVRSALPENTSLTRNSVPINGTSAEVSLQGSNISPDMSQLDIERINSQLTQTLALVSGIESVTLLFDDQPVITNAPDNYIEPRVNPVVSQNVVGVDGSALRIRSEVLNRESQQTVYSSSKGDMVHTAMGYNRQVFSYLSSDLSSVYLIKNSDSRVVLQGSEFCTPSFDQFQWMWAAEADATLHLVSLAGNDFATDEVQADWLDGARVSALRIARDGSRAAIVAESEGSSFLWISGVRRNADNKPEELIQPVRIATNFEISDARWTSDQSLVVANYQTGESELVYLSGEQSEISQLDSLAQIAACIGGDQVIAQTANQGIYMLVDRTWSRIETATHDFSYSG